jgi:hypothetical protein
MRSPSTTASSAASQCCPSTDARSAPMGLEVGPAQGRVLATVLPTAHAARCRSAQKDANAISRNPLMCSQMQANAARRRTQLNPTSSARLSEVGDNPPKASRIDSGQMRGDVVELEMP